MDWLKSPYQLKPYQHDVVRWMHDRETLAVQGVTGGIVRLDMGLGKSLIALTHCLNQPKGTFQTLIIASKTVMSEWKNPSDRKVY